MSTTITLNVTQNEGQTRQASIMVEDKKVLNSIIGADYSEITEEQYNQLRQKALTSGDMNVLEYCDLGAQDKLNLARINKYNDLYDIKLSDDGRFFEITVKKTCFLYPDPDGAVIKSDFGLRDGVLIQNNPDIFPDNPTNDARTFDGEKIKGGTTLRLPVGEVDFSNGPAGFWGRSIHVV